VLLLLVSTAWAICFVDVLDTRVQSDEDGFVRRDRWSIYVETGRAECAQLEFADDGGELTDLRIRIRHPDERTKRPDAAERWEELAPDARTLRPGAVLHLPELRFGDTVDLEMERRYGGGFTWQPAVWGPVGKARLAWSGAAPALHLAADMPEPAGEQEWTFTDVGSAELTATFGTPASHPVTVMANEQTVERSWTILSDLGRSVVETRSAPGRAGEHLAIAFPDSAMDVTCRAQGSTVPDVVRLPRGCVIQTDEEMDVVLEGQWSLPRPAIGGDVTLREPIPIASTTLDVNEPSGAIAIIANGDARVLGTREHLQVQAKALAPATPEGVSDPVVSWRVVGHGATDVLVDGDQALGVVARRALTASNPSPALPMGVRTRQPNDEVIAAILEYVRDQVRPGALPTTDTVEPRKLARVRRSGWASSWEMAVLLANYLRQTHVDAEPMMARSPRHGPPDPLNPWSYGDGAVVRMRIDDRELWIDPSCLQCAVGEIDPELWGASLLDETRTVLPQAPPSSQEREYTFSSDGVGSLRATFTGVSALRLRLALSDVRLADRSAWLAAHFGGDTLTSIEGLEPGAVLTLEVEGIRIVDPLQLRPGRWSIHENGEPRVRLPMEGTETVVVHGLPGGSPRHVERAGLVYDRIVTADSAEERITVADPVVSRVDVLSFLAQIAAE
jgi:hypothetical protein